MFRNMKIFLFCLVLLIFQNNLLADINSPHKDFIIKKTREISQNIKCLVCQNQSIDDSNSEIAKDLKVLIKDKLQDGISDDCLLYTSPSPRDLSTSRMPSSA